MLLLIRKKVDGVADDQDRGYVQHMEVTDAVAGVNMMLGFFSCLLQRTKCTEDISNILRRKQVEEGE